jgi:uncharacterized protein YjgD (DUF1641 family)
MSSEDRIAEALDRLSSRIEALEARLDAVSNLDGGAVDAINTFASKVPVLADAAGTTATWAWEQASSRGIDPIASGLVLAELGEKALGAAGELDPKELDVVLRQSAKMLGKLAKLLSTPELEKLLDAVDGATLAVAGHATTALVESKNAAIQPVGPMGAFLAMSDPDVKKAVGFGLAVAKRFGKVL